MWLYCRCLDDSQVTGSLFVTNSLGSGVLWAWWQLNTPTFISTHAVFLSDCNPLEIRQKIELVWNWCVNCCQQPEHTKPGELATKSEPVSSWHYYLWSYRRSRLQNVRNSRSISNFWLRCQLFFCVYLWQELCTLTTLLSNVDWELCPLREQLLNRR